jgi:hypothetical protein
VVLEGEDSEFTQLDAIVNGKWKPLEHVGSDVSPEHSASLRIILDDADGAIHSIKKLYSKCSGPIFVKLSGINEFRFSFGVICQAHPMALRAACMTSSWLRPMTVADVSSSSRLRSSCSVISSNDSALLSMLCPRSCAWVSLSETGRDIAASTISCVDIATYGTFCGLGQWSVFQNASQAARTF